MGVWTHEMKEGFILPKTQKSKFKHKKTTRIMNLLQLLEIIEVCFLFTVQVKHRTNKLFVMLYVSADRMFMQDTISEFQQMIDVVYKETSRQLLDVLHNKYKFMDHLKVGR